ncbi:MAG: tetratricopeptide repeat protein [Gammaproteobacteria bacterium]|nr:tetratricopeptide repeat protein [Gammaproteobacteria bacterium]
MRNLILPVILISLISACQQAPVTPTLRDVDTVKSGTKNAEIFVKPKSEEEIRQAYAEYLKYSATNDNSRMSAINRLAELEFKLSENLIKEKEKNNPNATSEQSDALYDARLDKTIELLETALREYPDAKNNDKIIYQLAKAYDQRDLHDKSIKALTRLAEKYKKSRYYTETQFRLGEEFFSRGNYLSAELAYSEVTASQNSDTFYEKALFKRGWSRFKQEIYTEAVDDYMEALTYHDFNSLDKLDDSERTQFDEYFRAISLSFSYLGGAESLHDYFKDKRDFKYIYYTYYTVSNTYLKQERFSDAADTLEQFVKYNPESSQVPYAKLAIIDIWRNSGFDNKIFTAIEDFYKTYSPDSNYWVVNKDPEIEKIIREKLKEYVLLVSAHYHNLYQKNLKQSHFDNASLWYQRYLKNYASQARKDNIYYLYAELLDQNKNWSESLKYYELAAYDNGIILNKEAAYATITLTDTLANGKDPASNQAHVKKHIQYATLFGQQYPQDVRSSNVLLHAAELAYNAKQYQDAILVSALVSESARSDIAYAATTILAQSYYELQDFTKAESIYTELAADTTEIKKRTDIENRMAICIYQQAEASKIANNIKDANAHYARISDVAAQSEIAPTALYNAVALATANNLWQDAIVYIKKFQSLYPDNQYSQDVTRKLSLAYLNSNQGIEAAREFEKISQLDNNAEVRMAALWQAAELYEEKKDYASAIRSYTEYANTFKTPYPQNMESMFKLTTLYASANNQKMSEKWADTIAKTDASTSKTLKNDRTRFISSSASLALAQASQSEYESYKLVEPLDYNLKMKKTAMLKSVNFYGQASQYGISEIVTQSTYSIARIYGDFSKALLNSERPKKLNAEELEQYQILLEDQAFPFEEKAIEFYETNLARVKDGIYTDWIKQSHAKLKELFPARYNREAKMDAYINVYQ